jgi:hypothetical protein
MFACGGVRAGVEGAGPGKAPPIAKAEEEESGLFGGIGVEWTIAYDTHYIFRGEPLQENTMWTQFSWDLELTESLSLNLTPWFLLDLDSEYNEFDLEGSLTLSAGGFDWSLGYAGYYYPRGALGDGEGIDDEQEMWAAVSREIGPVSATLLGAYSFTREAWYFEAAVEYPVEVNDWLTLTPAATLGWDVDYFDEGTNWNHATLQLTASIKLSASCSLNPTVGVNFPFGSLEYADEDVFGGVSLVVVF